MIYLINKSVLTKTDTQSEKDSPKIKSDVEEYNENEKRTKGKVERVLFSLAIVFIIISFIFAFALNMKSCENIFNQLLFGEE